QQIRRLFREGFVLMDADDPDFDPAIEGRMGVERFAAIAVGPHPEHVIAFTMGPDLDADFATYVLGTIRHVINLRLNQGHMLSDLEEARRIQTSLLPTKPPSFHDFDFSAHSITAERVGGDLYDYVPLSRKSLGVAIADACGHGLPAALVARDVITALRVVLDIHYRLTHAIERVNRVIARASLASRFISLFYAELEPSGNLVYCNAGHPPPLLLRRRGIDLLTRGGIVLGPDPDAAYERGFKNFPPDSVLVMYTDGITEALSPRGAMFGLDGLTRCVSDWRGLEARQIVDRVFDAVAHHSPLAPDDDQTVLVVRRPPQ
ncbi:MAG: PP2C family protein-serine/threonine phosphatase, partial [Acidobacteriota bacterium]|nr:PP2C family protein-serine/threonine phosphatase [Acidobacteriota bacterium]